MRLIRRLTLLSKLLCRSLDVLPCCAIYAERYESRLAARFTTGCNSLREPDGISISRSGDFSTLTPEIGAWTVSMLTALHCYNSAGGETTRRRRRGTRRDCVDRKSFSKRYTSSGWS